MARTAALVAAATAACAAAGAPDARFLVGPQGFDPTTDCAMRWLTYNYSLHLQPQRAPLATVFDALRLAIDCNGTLPAAPADSAAARASIRSREPRAFAATYYADPVKGSDANPGTQGAPFKTLGRAVTASRAGPRPPQILLRAGTFYLPAAITLSAADSGLTIAAFPGESPVLSGGIPLDALAWEPVQRPGPPPPPITGPTPGTLLTLGGGGCVDAPGLSNPGICAPLGQLPSAAACADACLGNASCTGYTYHLPGAGPRWSTWCYARLDGMDTIVDPDSNHLSGYKPVSSETSTWRASVAGSGATLPFSQLYYSGADGGRRAIRARFPNANPETEQSPVGFTSGETAVAGEGLPRAAATRVIIAPQPRAGSPPRPSPPPTRPTSTASAPTTRSSPTFSGAWVAR